MQKKRLTVFGALPYSSDTCRIKQKGYVLAALILPVAYIVAYLILRLAGVYYLF